MPIVTPISTDVRKICEDVKRKDHRDISVTLQGLTAKATNGALLETQRLLIPAAPDTDGIRCKVKDSAIVHRLVGHQVYNLACGVCCKVGGARYVPTQVAELSEARALNFVARSTDGNTEPGSHAAGLREPHAAQESCD